MELSWPPDGSKSLQDGFKLSLFWLLDRIFASRSPKVGRSWFYDGSTVAYGYSLLTTRYSLLTPHYSLLASPYSLLTTHYSLLTTHDPQLMTHYALLTTHHSLLGHRCSGRFYARSDVHCSRRSSQGTWPQDAASLLSDIYILLLAF